MPAFKVIIIGAGLAGSCLANGLVSHDIDVMVYERLAQDSKREGYQIRLGAQALRGLRANLSQEHLQRVVQKFGPASGKKSEAPVVVNKKFETVLDLSKFPTYNKSAPISRVVLRDALAEPLARVGRLKYGMQFSRYEILSPETLEERVRVWFEDGSHYDCDVLIAADGSHSKVNTQIGLNNIKQLDGHISMVAKSELPTKRFRDTNPRIVSKPSMAFAENKSLYYCAYLPESQNQEQKYDDSLSSSMFGFNVPVDSTPADLAQMRKEKKWEFVRDSMKDWAKEYHEIVDLVIDSDPYVYRARVSSDPGKNWRSKVKLSQTPELGHHRVWFVGDSMHAMLPNRGMGGNTAISDTATALPLLTRLALFASSSGGRVDYAEVVKACNEYEAEMMPRAFAWVQKSGGRNMVPISTETIAGRVVFAFAAIAMQAVSVWYAFAGLFVNRTFVDEAPELQ